VELGEGVEDIAGDINISSEMFSWFARKEKEFIDCDAENGDQLGAFEFSLGELVFDLLCACGRDSGGNGGQTTFTFGDSLGFNTFDIIDSSMMTMESSCDFIIAFAFGE
jgi:hypothetical protein